MQICDPNIAEIMSSANYDWITFEMGEDQYGNVHSESFKNHMCDDISDEMPCTR